MTDGRAVGGRAKAAMRTGGAPSTAASPQGRKPSPARPRSHRDLPDDARNGGAAHPDGALDVRDRQKARAPDTGSLGHRVGEGDVPSGEEPLADRSVETARHRVLGHAGPRGEGADLVGRLAGAPPAARADDADHRFRKPGEVGFQCEDLFGVGDLDGGPSGPVVHPQRRGDLGEPILLDRTAAARRGRLEGEVGAVADDRHEPCAAFLDDAPPCTGRSSTVEPGPRRAERGMPGEGKLLEGREDADGVVGVGGGGRRSPTGSSTGRSAA